MCAATGTCSVGGPRAPAGTSATHGGSTCAGPPELVRVTVAPLWSDYFRVNVFTGSAAGVSIPNSYFVTADAAGAILRASPPIEKQY